MHVMVVDASPLIYSSFNTVGHLSNSKGEPTGLRYGFVRAVRAYADRFKVNKVVIVWDMPGAVKKAEGVETYKANRPWSAAKEKMYSQVPALKELVSLTCWTQVWAEGYEADDVIGTLARKLESQGQKVTVVTSDNDMSQLISESVSLFVPGKSAKLRTKKDVRENFGVDPENLLLYRCFAGDSSDNIEGVISGKELTILKGIINAAAEDMRKEAWVDPLNFLLFLHARPLCREFADLFLKDETALKTLDVNYRLMRLHEPPELVVKKGAKDAGALHRLFEELEMKSMFKFAKELAGVEE